jgi:hypothetical protein
MANELNITLSPATQSGLTLAARLYAAGNLSPPVALTELPAGSGCYTNTGSLPTLAAGIYAVAVDSGSTLVGTGTLNWSGTAEVIPLAVGSVVTLPTTPPAGYGNTTISVEQEPSITVQQS